MIDGLYIFGDGIIHIQKNFFVGGGIELKFDRCPYCSGKLIHGYIKTRDEALTWSTDSKIPVFPDSWHYLQEDVKLGNFRYFKGDKIDAYRCDTCHVIIIADNKE